jgi:hypothetical protein
MAAFTDKDGNELAIQISVSQSFFEGSGVSYATTVPQSAKQEEIDEINDRIMAAIQRQEKWARISGLNNDLETHAKQKAQLEFSLRSLEKRNANKPHVGQDVRAAQEQGEESLLRIKILMEALEQEQKRLREGLE